MLKHKKLVASNVLLTEALKNKTAIGAFNFSNMETIQAIVEAANEQNVPVVIQASESAIRYMGMEYVIALTQAALNNTKVDIALHLDHGKNFDICKECVDAGFSSVMIDASSLSFEDNVKKTKEVVEYASRFNVSVEAELGTLSGIEDEVNVEEKDAFFTDPNSAATFRELTNISSLAIAIGTSHGLNKGKFGSPKLDFERLRQIKEKTQDLPLVLHGASSVYHDEISKANQYGAKITNAFGIPDDDIKQAIQNGIAKVNVDTDIRIAFLAGVREVLQKTPSSIDFRKYLTNAKVCSREIVSKKLKTFS